MAIHPRHRGHGEGQEAPPHRVQQRPEAVRLYGVGEVETVGVELRDGAGGDDHAGGVTAELEDVKRGEQRGEEGRREAVVWGAEEAEDVDLGLGGGAGYGAPGVGSQRGDGDGEEGFLSRHVDGDI